MFVCELSILLNVIVTSSNVGPRKLTFFMKPSYEGDHGKFNPGQELPPFKTEKHGALFCVTEHEPSDILFRTFCFGKFSAGLLVLSPYEVFFINCIDPRSGTNLSNLWLECSRLCAPGVFATRYAVYHFYRCNLWVVRDGSTFGGDFVLYSDHPDVVHSKFIVIVLDTWDNKDQDLIMASRVGWSVKKEVIFVRVFVPDNADLSSPECLQQLVIEDVAIKRVKFRG